MSDKVKARVVQIMKEIQPEADRISGKVGGAPVVVIIAGLKEAEVPRCVTVSSNLSKNREGRLRDLLGILQTAIQIESLDHLLRQRA